MLGDILVGLDTRPVRSTAGLMAALDERRPGDKVGHLHELHHHDVVDFSHLCCGRFAASGLQYLVAGLGWSAVEELPSCSLLQDNKLDMF